MFGAVIVDDPATQGLDLGEQISWSPSRPGVGVPTTSNLAARLLRTFFIATNPGNWLDYTAPGPWRITCPERESAGYRWGGRQSRFLSEYNGIGDRERQGQRCLVQPSHAGGWGNLGGYTIQEKTRGKSKPGTATAVSGQTWVPTRKVALPQINMNNPRNMWTDRNQNLIYQTQWFDSKLTVFNRTTGQFLNNISVGESPSHVMTRVDTDRLRGLERSPTRRFGRGAGSIGQRRSAAHQYRSRHSSRPLDEP